MKKLILALAWVCCGGLYTGFAQSSPSEAFLPMQDIDQSHKKIAIVPMNMGFTVHANIIADLKNYDDCHSTSNIMGRLDMQVDWYDTRDATGKMMADMARNDMLNIMRSFKESAGFADIKLATESNIKGGKMWLYSRNKPCVNSISGATGETEYFTQIRAFVFAGDKILKIDLSAKSNPARLEGSLKHILEKWEGFDYSTVK